MDTGRSISFTSSRQANDRLFNHSVHLSSPSQWPHVVRPESYYLGAHVLSRRDKPKTVPADDFGRAVAVLKKHFDADENRAVFVLKKHLDAEELCAAIQREE